MKPVMVKMMTVLGVALLIATGTTAQGMGSGHGEGRQGMKRDKGDGPVLSMMLIKALERPEFVQRVGLTEAQVSKLKGLAEEQKESREKSTAILEPLQKQLAEAIESDTPNISNVESLIDKIGYERAESQKQSIRAMLEMKTVLTKEQIATIKELVEEYGPGKMGDNGSGKKGKNKWKQDSSKN